MIEDGEVAAKQKLAEKGEKLVEPTPADFARAREITRPLWDAWAKENPASPELLAKVSQACVK